MSGENRVLQLVRIGIVAHLAVGLVVLCGSRSVTPDAAATLYGALIAAAAVFWAWPFALALWHQSALESLKRHHGGVLERAGWLAPFAALRFDDASARGRLEVHVASPWPRHPVLIGRMLVRPAAPLAAPVKFQVRLVRNPAASYARVSTPLGEPELDARLVFAAGSSAQLEALITHGLRAPLLELYQLSSNLDVLEIDFDGTTLTVMRSLMVCWQEDWAPWALRVFDRAGRRILDVLASLQPLEDQLEESLTLEFTSQADSEVLCLVCAAAVDGGRIAVCQSCDTPLHLECWSYNGMCALFGCGSTRSRERVISSIERRRSTVS